MEVQQLQEEPSDRHTHSEELIHACQHVTDLLQVSLTSLIQISSACHVVLDLIANFTVLAVHQRQPKGLAQDSQQIC